MQRLKIPANISAVLLCLSISAASQSPSNYKGRIAVITGSSSGIGRALAVEAAQRGMKLVLADIDLAGSLDLARTIRKNGGEALALRIDVSRAKDRKRLIKRTVEEFGGIDILFNNAGYGYMASQEHIDLQAAKRQFEVNFFAYVDLTQRVIPYMKKAKTGMIVNIASIMGLVPGFPYTSMYAASKHAVVGWGRTIAEELKGDGIHVKVVCPSGVKTNFKHHMKGYDKKPVKEWINTAEPSFDDPQTVAADIFSQLSRKSVIILPGKAKQNLPETLVHLLLNESSSEE